MKYTFRGLATQSVNYFHSGFILSWTVRGVLFGVGKPYSNVLLKGEYSTLGDKIFKKFNGSSSQLFINLMLILERLLNGFRKTESEVITAANHDKHKLPNEAIGTRNKYM